MRKTRFIALVLVVAMMLAGAGYAAWTDQLKVNTTVNTGELDIAFESSYGFNGGHWAAPHVLYKHADGTWRYDDPRPKTGDTVTNDYLDPATHGFTANVDDIDDEKDILNLRFDNMYPGTQARSFYKMTNVGSVPAVFDSINVEYGTLDGMVGDDGVAQLPEAILVQGVLSIRRMGVATPQQLGTLTNVSLADLEDELSELLVGVTLNPEDEVLLGDGDGDTFKNYITFEVPTSLEYSEGENESVKVTIDFNFIQHNLHTYVQPE